MEETDGTVSHTPSPVNTGTEDLLNENSVQVLTRNLDPHPVLNPDENGAGYVGGGGGLGLTDTEVGVVKRKRGRPKKYDVVNGNIMGHVSSPPPPPGVSSPVHGGGSSKRARGRPKGSGKLQLLAASLGGSAIGTAGGSFTPHVMTVETGEDVVSRILSSQKGPRAVCILSATGVVSSVTIRHTSGVFLKYEGRFEILSLSGSFVSGALSGSHRKNGTLSVLLAKPDGGVFGGGVVGSLLAAGPIQLIVGSFKQDFGKQLKSRLSAEPSICASMLHSSELVRVPVLMAPSADGDDSCVTPTSALPESARGGGGSVIAPNQAINRTSLHSIGQNVLQASQVLADHRSSPENINFSHM